MQAPLPFSVPYQKWNQLSCIGKFEKFDKTADLFFFLLFFNDIQAREKKMFRLKRYNLKALLWWKSRRRFNTNGNGLLIKSIRIDCLLVLCLFTCTNKFLFILETTAQLFSYIFMNLKRGNWLDMIAFICIQIKTTFTKWHKIFVKFISFNQTNLNALHRNRITFMIESKVCFCVL